MSGKYRIKCIAPDGFESYSADINLGWGENWINNQMANGCDRMYDVTEVQDANKYSYGVNGKGFFVRFIGMNANPGQFEIVSSETDPLVGGNISYYSNTTVPYSSNLFFEPIPFEMLRTFETKPQLIVSVGNEPAVCHNLTCDFTYIMPEGNITAFTYTESTKKLVITGVNLPSVLSNISSVEYALAPCTVDNSTLSNTTLECTLDKEPTCGDYKPILTSVLGVIPTTDAVSPQTITCTVSVASPATGLNLLGGDNITISGTNLPHNLITSNISVTLSDTQNTQCVAQISSTGNFVCLTSAFDTSVSAGQSVTATIVINGQTVSNSLSLTMKSDVKSSLALIPPSASPVLKSKITVQMETDFPYTLVKEDLSMNATSVTDSSYIRYLNVIEVNDTAKTFTAMFGGAYSG